MSKMYSAHPALALNQLQCAELEKKNNSLYNVLQNKWHNSGSPTLQDILVANLHKKTLPDRTVPKNNKDDVNEDDMVYEERDDSDNISKDCMNCTAISENEPDTLQQRFNCRNSTSDIRPQSVYSGLNPQRLEQLQLHLTQTKDDIVGCLSGVSSTKSSPSASTVSTPLSTPTRLTPHHQVHKKSQFCCHKYIKPVSEIISSEKKHITTSTIHIGIDSREKCLLKQHGKSEHQTNHHTFHHHHHRHNHTMSSVKNGCKKLRKLDSRLGPSPYRQLLPIALCILSFAVVFSLLIIYMDTTEIRHQQFRLNMSRDYDMYGVAQDDPQLIEFLREIHMRKYPMHFLKSRNIFTDSPILTPKVKNIENLETTDGHISENILNSNSVQMSNKTLNFSASYDKNDLAPSMASYIATLVGNKPYEGSFIQSLPGSLGHLLTAPWLAETLNWVGIIVEPEARRYFALHKQNAQRAGMQVVQACVSPTPYPKEVTLHNEDSEVRINSLLDEETSWFNPRVKCFPLYTIMLACNRTQYDLLSLGVHGHELEILQTLPFEKLQIAVISIHLPDDHEDAYSGSSQQYIQAITQFLMNKSYKMQRQFGRNFFYQRTQHFTNRTRKKDILLLKTP